MDAKTKKAGGDRPLSVWSYKPWWCQPWSIVLTGSSLILGSWLLLNRYWITGIVAMPVLAWMGFFLLLWPRAMHHSGMLEELAMAKSVSDTPDNTPP